MDYKQEILLGSEKNINSVNVDNYKKIEITNNISEINEFTVNDVVNSSLAFDIEREENQVYRFYGRIEFLSLLNGLKDSYSDLPDFFTPIYDGNSKNIINSFDFYLVAPSSDEVYENISGTSYQRSFDVISSRLDIEIYNAGFTNNVYGEQVYTFNFKSDFDVSNYFDSLGFPLTEMFIYAQYKPQGSEELLYTTWTIGSGLPNKISFHNKNLNVGDIVETNGETSIMDVITYVPAEYLQEQNEQQKFYIRTPYDDNGTKWLEWTYNPFISLRLRYLDGVISSAPLSEIIGNTSLLSVQLSGISSTNFTTTKLLKKSIINSVRTINEWDSGTTTGYTWNYTDGELFFISSGSYEINFQTEIRLPIRTDKYVAETYLEEYSSGSWSEIPNTRRKYQISSSIQGTSIIKSFGVGDGIRVRILLIPNPEERKVYNIPDYAKMIESTGKYVWRDILPQGYVDPITNLGVDYPFFNGKRYLFNRIVFDVAPNLSDESYNKHQNTVDVFNEISYHNNATTLDLTPATDNQLNNIGKPCQ